MLAHCTAKEFHLCRPLFIPLPLRTHTTPTHHNTTNTNTHTHSLSVSLYLSLSRKPPSLPPLTTPPLPSPNHSYSSSPLMRLVIPPIFPKDKSHYNLRPIWIREVQPLYPLLRRLRPYPHRIGIAASRNSGEGFDSFSSSAALPFLP